MFTLPISLKYLLTLAWTSLIRVLESGTRGVTNIPADSLKKFLDEHESAAVMFFDPSCRYSQVMKREYVDAGEELGGSVPLAMVDVTRYEREFFELYDLRGLPALLFYENGLQSRYMGERTSQGVIDWIANMSALSVTRVKSREEAFQFARSKNQTTLSYCGPAGGDEAHSIYKLFHKTAFDNKGDISFVERECDEDGAVELIKSDGTSVRITDVSSSDKIMNFVKKEFLGYFEELGPGNAKQYSRSGLELVYFGGTVTDYLHYKPIVENVAKKFRGSLLFTFIDTEKYLRQSRSLMKTTKFPSFAINRGAMKGIYQVADRNEFTEIALTSWLNEVKKGEAPTRPTSPYTSVVQQTVSPKQHQPSSVDLLVPDNWSSIVREDKDVFVYIKAEWCNICRIFDPTFYRLADRVKSVSPNTVIGVIDGDANHIPGKGYDFIGYPSFYFKPAKGRPEIFLGERTEEAMYQHIKFFGTNNFEDEDIDAPPQDST